MGPCRCRSPTPSTHARPVVQASPKPAILAYRNSGGAATAEPSQNSPTTPRFLRSATKPLSASEVMALETAADEEMTRVSRGCTPPPSQRLLRTRTPPASHASPAEPPTPEPTRDGIRNGVRKYHPDNTVPLHHTPFSARVDRVMRFGW